MRWDGTEGRVACGPLSGSFNQNITRSADDGSRGHSRAAAPSAVGRSVGRSEPPLSAHSEPTDNRRVGRSATVSRDHTSFVRVVWMEAVRRPKRRPVWSPSPVRLLSPLHSWHKTKDGSLFSAEPTKGAQKRGRERGRDGRVRYMAKSQQLYAKRRGTNSCKLVYLPVN